MPRYALAITTDLPLFLHIVAAQGDFGAGDTIEDAFDVYSFYLDSLSYYMPDSFIKFFFNIPPLSQRIAFEACEEQNNVRECKVRWDSTKSVTVLLLSLLLLALLLGVLIFIMRSMLRKKVGRVEASQLMHRKQSGFELGLGISRADGADTVVNEVNDEEELDARPGHLHAVSNTKGIALISDPVARQRCHAAHSPSASPLPFIEDILLDKSGLEDVPCPPSPDVQKEILMSVETLNTVPERMCEESFDDSHAFCDAPANDNVGKPGGRTVSRKFLSRVDECSDELEKSSTNNRNQNDVTMRAQ